MGSSLPPRSSGSLPTPSLSLHLFLLASGQDCGVQVRGTCLLRCAAPPPLPELLQTLLLPEIPADTSLLPEVSESSSQLLKSLEAPFHSLRMLGALF